MDEDNNQAELLITALRHEIQHLTMQVKMLQQSVDSLKNKSTPEGQIVRNNLGAWSIGKLKGQN